MRVHMGEQAEPHSQRPTRRAVLGSVGVGLGAALAGCAGLLGEGEASSEHERIAELETELAAVREENAALSTRVTELEDERDRLRRRLETGNLWGFDRETMAGLQELADTWANSVVVIDVITDDGLWSIGTGWVYGEGIVATNAHVIAPRRLPDEHPVTEFQIWDRDGTRSHGTVLGHTYGEDDIFDNREDIGFLSVDESLTDDRVMDRGVSRELIADEPLVQIGHPYSLESWTPSVGPFIAHREPFFVTNVPGQPGVSGSPVLDLDGDVVGMTWGGQYVRRPQREVGSPPEPGVGEVLPAFETAINGVHSYVHRIERAANQLT